MRRFSSISEKNFGFGQHDNYFRICDFIFFANLFRGERMRVFVSTFATLDQQNSLNFNAENKSYSNITFKRNRNLFRIKYEHVLWNLLHIHLIRNAQYIIFHTVKRTIAFKHKSGRHTLEINFSFQRSSSIEASGGC